LKKKFNNLLTGKVSRSVVARTGFFVWRRNVNLLASQKKKVVDHPRSASVFFPGFLVNPVEQVGVYPYLD
jgi:hypothetical protein